MKVAFVTLGCKVNQVESGAMAAAFEARGHEITTPRRGDADLYILNTCTVTAESDRKVRSLAAQLRRNHPGALLGVCGCYVERGGSCEADLLGGASSRMDFVERAEALFQTRTPVPPVSHSTSNIQHSTLEIERLPTPKLARTRAFVKIQDGCNNFCTYCIIPHVRGRSRSLPPDEVISQLESLSAQEIVITGIEIASWGRDLPGTPRLGSLLRRARAAVPSARLRLGSLDPRVIDEDFLVAAQAARICPHFHLSLQSGCDTTLRRMGRKYDTTFYLERLSLLRATFPDAAVTTDLIVGFPGESDADFQESIRFLETCAFAGVHVFPFSARPGTPAADLPDKHTAAVKKARVQEALTITHRLRNTYLDAMIGHVYPVLFETKKHDLCWGHAENYMWVGAPDATPGAIQAVRILRREDDRLIGEITL